MHLGIDSNNGLVYEGFGNPDIPAVPTPHITLATLIKSDEDWKKLPSSISHCPVGWVFREDSFDAVTRTRRGRLYAYSQGDGQPSSHRVTPHPYEDPFGRSAGQGGKVSKSLYTYMACTALLSEPRRGEGATLALGTANAASAWRIVQTEVLASNCILVTLKALSAFGILPELNMVKIDVAHQPAVKQAMARVLDSAFRETPISVIDHCKNAMAVILARWLVQQGHDSAILDKDIGKVANAILNKPHEFFVTGNLAQALGLLHARGKGNVQHAMDARIPVEEDAQLALEALGLAMRDIGWAAN